MQRQACYTVGLYTGQFTLYTCINTHTHDCSVLLTVPPPSSGKYIHGGRVGERKGRGKVYYLFVTKSVHHFGELFYTVLQHFIPNYCTVHLITLYFNYWVIQYIYTYTFPTRYEIQYIRYICIYTHLLCIYT